MKLRERYSDNSSNIGTLCMCLILLAVFFSFYFTVARYRDDYSGYAGIDIARWQIKINGNTVTSSAAELTDTIKLIPTENVDAERPDTVKAGQSGYFDIAVDPSGTEVSFGYKISIDAEKTALPENFAILSYSINNGTAIALSGNGTVSAEILLNGKDAFTEEDAQTIRYFWMWEQGADDSDEYAIYLKVDLTQIV